LLPWTFVPSTDLLLHPVRLRVLKAFLGDRALTTSQLAQELADVPTGSLYRHVAKLARAGILQVVAERRVHGIVERTYTLRARTARIGVAEAEAMSAEEHDRAFTAYVAGLLADAGRYINGPSPDFARDGFNYQTAAMWLTDAEYGELVHELVKDLQPRLANGPKKGRKRRILYSVFLPGPEEQGHGGRGQAR
jgi:AcrR family transcriptional regulator